MIFFFLQGHNLTLQRLAASAYPARCPFCKSAYILECLYSVHAREPGGWIAKVTALAGGAWRHGEGNRFEIHTWIHIPTDYVFEGRFHGLYPLRTMLHHPRGCLVDAEGAGPGQGAALGTLAVRERE